MKKYDVPRGVTVTEAADGEYCLASDVADLEAAFEALVVLDREMIDDRDARIAELEQALRELVQAADHVGSRVYDWKVQLPLKIEKAQHALGKGEAP